MKKHILFLALAGSLGAVAAPALSQQTVIVSLCQDGAAGSAPQDLAAVGAYLDGPWQMSAVGTGYTMGTNEFVVNLGYDAEAGAIRMTGPGPSLTLNPLTWTVAADGSETPNAPFDMAVEALTPAELSEDDLEVLIECRTPQRFWWEFGAGAQRSWGGLMFYSRDAGVGFMANSAGGSRFVMLSRM